LVNVCAEAGCERIGLETDGGALSVPGNARGVLSAGVTHLYVRLFSADPSRGDALSGRHGRTAAAAAGVAMYREAAREQDTPVVVTALIPLCSHNLAMLPETVGALSTWGADAVRLTVGGTLARSAESVVAAACDTGMVNQLWVEADDSVPLPVSHALHRCRWSVGHV
jgi:NifB/MoaA-like Fe-S oxidoreductase